MGALAKHSVHKSPLPVREVTDASQHSVAQIQEWIRLLRQAMGGLGTADQFGQLDRLKQDLVHAQAREQMESVRVLLSAQEALRVRELSLKIAQIAPYGRESDKQRCLNRRKEEVQRAARAYQKLLQEELRRVHGVLLKISTGEYW